MNPSLRVFCSVAIALALGSAGCNQEAPPPPKAATPALKAPPSPSLDTVNFSTVTLGNTIGKDRKVLAEMDTFSKTDVVYAVVETTGSGTVSVKTKWTHHGGGKVTDVIDAVEQVTTEGPAISAFPVNSLGGWRLGEHQVEIFFDDKSVITKKFTVK